MDIDKIIEWKINPETIVDKIKKICYKMYNTTNSTF